MENYEIRHLELLRPFLPECTVLLKSNGDFPLEAAGRIALFGSGARHTIKGGTGSAEVNSRFFITVEQGLAEAGFTVVTNGKSSPSSGHGASTWLDDYDKVRETARTQFVASVKARAKRNHRMAIIEGLGAVMPEPEYDLPLDADADVAVYVLSRISGEGSDRDFARGDILLSQTEQRDILELNRLFPKFMLVLNVGGVVDLSPVMEVDNILLLSQLGVETGKVLANLLLGTSYPSGKLTATWAAWDTYPTIGDFGDVNDTHYREGIYVGYRYFDTTRTLPLFPFGHGLGYTTFSLDNCDFDIDGERVCAQARIANTGSRPGKETLQLYVSSPEGKLDQPYQALAAFGKTRELAPGETETLELSFNLSSLASYDPEAQAYVLEAGDYLLRLGTSSQNTALIGAAHLPSSVCVKQVENLLGTPDFSDWKPAQRPACTLPENAKRLTIEPESIQQQSVAYRSQAPFDPTLAHRLSDEELVLTAVGAFDPNAGSMGIVGNAGKSVAGAAGETTSKLADKGIPALVMADGPAGLRLSRNYVQRGREAISLELAIPESLNEFLSLPLRLIMNLSRKKPKRGEEIRHQYCTALPIGTAIAQSWNLEFAQLCGDIVGSEMERFGVNLWLAPALNIQRSIQCGRNFEYYSEDPLISGLFAAALVNGVQGHAGCGATIKHFAANNQETNRYNSNSQVSERAMREIYLRGFETCIRLSHPCAVMTSYNLLNGSHTSELSNLTERILRDEFGFEGIVMTDWIVNGGTMLKESKHPAPEPWRIAQSGGIMMPGGKKEYENILNTLRSGKLDRQSLASIATNLAKTATTLNK